MKIRNNSNDKKKNERNRRLQMHNDKTRASYHPQFKKHGFRHKKKKNQIVKTRVEINKKTSFKTKSKTKNNKQRNTPPIAAIPTSAKVMPRACTSQRRANSTHLCHETKCIM
jgi:hypothetical protein